jgi:serine/threonine-protein kinase
MGPQRDLVTVRSIEPVVPGGEPSITVSDTAERSLWRAATVVNDTLASYEAVAAPDAVVLTLRDGRYQTREVLGVGGMGEVRLCRDEAIGRDVALKTLIDARQANASAQRRFLREARVQGQLEHPSIVPVYDIDTTPEGELFFTMRRVRGHTLAEILEALASGDVAMQASYSRRKLLGAFVRVCLAIDYAHARGVLHRDLKPSNLMLGDFGEVYVLDWGVARLVTEHATSAPIVVQSADLVHEGSMVGTPGYMSPEQLFGLGESQDARTDVYSLGAILFEILTYRRLHQGTTFEALATSTGQSIPARPSTIASEVPPELDEACARAASRDRADRYACARELADAVERYLDGDRDLERRRGLSTERADAAAIALAQGTAADVSEQVAAVARTSAVREVTAALALDPDNAEARTLLVRLFVEPPTRMPPEVEAEIATATNQNRVELARFGSYALGCWMLTAPVVMLMGVRSWPPVLFCTLLSVASFLFSTWFRRAVHPSVGHFVLLAALTFATVASASGWLGPFVVVPQAASVATLWITLHGHTRRERGMVIAMGVLAVALPFLVELSGVFPPAYSFADGNLTLLARAQRFSAHTTVPMMFYVGVSFVVLPAIFLGRVREALSAAERQLFLQAWHLRQLLPEKSPAAETIGT